MITPLPAVGAGGAISKKGNSAEKDGKNTEYYL
jgi:hypothetical protein